MIDATEEEADARAKAAVVPAQERVPRWMVGAAFTVIAAACALAIWVTLPSGGVAVEASDQPRVVNAAVGDLRSTAPDATAVGSAIVVDVEGAVPNPGLHSVSADGRVGDAIAAAGGYDAAVDIDAAGRTLNLAAKLTDGQQIRVPALGDVVVGTPPPVGGGGGADPGSAAPGGLIDINHATSEELDTLPGIGPVTAQKIIDARTETPFATIDELQSRGVVGPSTYEKLGDLITVTP